MKIARTNMMKPSHTTGAASRAQRRGVGALTLAALLASAAPAGAQVTADSFADFSGVQGFNGWYYGFFDGDSDQPWSMADFEELSYFDGIIWRRTAGADYWTALMARGGHPNGVITSGGRIPEENWAVRRWVSDGHYVLMVSGQLWDANPVGANTQGNGVVGYVMVDGAAVWQAAIEPGDTIGTTYNLEVCTVPGTVLDFAIDPRDGDDLFDETGFTARIQSIIEHGPEDTISCPGGTVEFMVIAAPSALSFQWRHNGEPITHDGNSHRLRIVNVDAKDAGSYDCVVSGMCGSMASIARHPHDLRVGLRLRREYRLPGLLLVPRRVL